MCRGPHQVRRDRWVQMRHSGNRSNRSVHAQVIAAAGTTYLIPTLSNYSMRMEARKTLARD
jgi:hypothetical protein